MQKNPWYAPGEVALMLGVCTETVRRWCRKGHLYAEKRGPKGRFMIPASELDRVLAEEIAYRKGEADGQGDH